MRILKTMGILLIIVAVFGAAMFGLNFYTGPIIEANSAGAANDRLNAVMPEGAQGFKDITAELTMPEEYVDSANSFRTAKIVAVHEETSGLGYVVEVAWTSEDSHGDEPNLVLVGITTDGKIIKINNEAYHDTDSYNIFNKDPNYTATFEGKDSALTDVGLVGGSTHSSSAFRSAVAYAFEVLIVNDMVSAGVKTDAQILAEMIPALHTGLTSGGSLKAEAVAASGNITEGYKALNGSGYAFIVKSGEASMLAIVNASGACNVYDTTGADVTESNAAVVAEAVAAAEIADVTAAAEKMITDKFADATEITPIELTTFGNVVYASSFTSGEATYYAFYSRPLTFEDNAMEICTVLDENGAIVSQDVKEMAFGHGVEYMHGIQDLVDPSGSAYGSYLEKFNGITGETLTDDVLVAGGTVSSTAVKLATQDAFNEFNAIKGGEQ